MNQKWLQRKKERDQNVSPAPRPERPPRQPRPERKPKVREKPVRESDVPVPNCTHRGQVVGTINCGCQGAPEIYACSFPLMPIWTSTVDSNAKPNYKEPGAGYCLLYGKPMRSAEIEVKGGENIKLAHRLLPCCNVCRVGREQAEAAKPPEPTPVDPWQPPQVGAETLAVRKTLCNSCQVRDRCGMPEGLCGCLLVACPDGRWKAGELNGD